MADATTLTVKILDKEYQVSCEPDEIQALQQSANYVDDKMRKIKETSTVLGLDRVAVMAALNIANDYITQSQKTDEVRSDQGENIRSLTGKIDQVITRLKTPR